MAFHLIDIQNWSRREFYEHFIHEVACSYSTTVHLDITCLKEYKLYPSMLWLLTKTVNELPQFRTALTEDGLGFYDDMHPSYTIFNKDAMQKNFCCMNLLIRGHIWDRVFGNRLNLKYNRCWFYKNQQAHLIHAAVSCAVQIHNRHRFVAVH